ncbi:MAG: thioredoxin family protein [Acidovorax sp.]|uniref:thioredoxin family protein n=1 Tax=Acidovorax sp. TaxID=1872122 RepID=UPI0039E44B3D
MDESSSTPWWVVCLCAQWCGTCRDYRDVFDALAQEHPEARFAWVDIEDESELAGDLEVETFPTLLIADGTRALFLGPLLPQAGVLARLLASLRAADGGASAGPLAQTVFERVRAARG